MSVFNVQYRGMSWHGNIICHLQASFILKNDIQEVVKKESSSLPRSNQGSMCLLAISITQLQHSWVHAGLKRRAIISNSS